MSHFRAKLQKGVKVRGKFIAASGIWDVPTVAPLSSGASTQNVRARVLAEFKWK